jgi:ariadne-1
MRCQGYKCTVVLPSSAQLSFLPVDKREKLTRWLLDDFVSRHPKDFKWCPSAGCVMSAQRADTLSTKQLVGGVDCTCASAWCFDCALEDHKPASCEDAKKWHDKNSSDAENVNWILANTKVCPKCQVNIEKNQGCNHMSQFATQNG